MTDVESDFTSILVGSICEGRMCDFLIPSEIHWHIYPIPAGETPKHSMVPEGLFEAQIHDEVLFYRLKNILEESGYKKGDRLQAGISLFIPTNSISAIKIEGVKQFVQVNADDERLSTIEEPLRIVSTAIDTQVRVLSPYWKVYYTETGVDNEVSLEVASKSSLDIAGVDIDVYVRCPDSLTVLAHGIDNHVFIEGQLLSASMEGVDVDIEINDSTASNPCSNVSDGGVGNDCDVSNDVFEMLDLSCLADTRAGYQCSFNLSKEAEVGIGIGVSVFFVAAISSFIFLCARYCCCCRPDGSKKQNPEIYPTVAKTSEKNSQYHVNDNANISVVEAEVLEIKHFAEEGVCHDDDDLGKAKCEEAAQNC